MTVAELKAFIDNLLEYQPSAAQGHIVYNLPDGSRVRIKAENIYGILVFVPEEPNKANRGS